MQQRLEVGDGLVVVVGLQAAHAQPAQPNQLLQPLDARRLLRVDWRRPLRQRVSLEAHQQQSHSHRQRTFCAGLRAVAVAVVFLRRGAESDSLPLALLPPASLSPPLPLPLPLPLALASSSSSDAARFFFGCSGLLSLFFRLDLSAPGLALLLDGLRAALSSSSSSSPLPFCFVFFSFFSFVSFFAFLCLVSLLLCCFFFSFFDCAASSSASAAAEAAGSGAALFRFLTGAASSCDVSVYQHNVDIMFKRDRV